MGTGVSTFASSPARRPPAERSGLRCDRGHLSSAVVIAPALPPAPFVAASLQVGGRVVDLATHVLVAGVVPAPRFGRDGEVAATARSVVASGADLADVSLAPRLIAPAARAGQVPVAARVGSIDEAAAAVRAGASVVLLEPWSLVDLSDEGARAALGAAAVIVDDLDGMAAGRAQAERLALPLAFDSTHWSSASAVARESVAVAEGCRLLRSTDVRRSRRVAEVMGAILSARRPTVGPATDQMTHERRSTQ